jgi:hypothetical protein
MNEQAARVSGRPGLERRVGLGREVAVIAAQQRLDVSLVDLDDQHVCVGAVIGPHDPDLTDSGVGATGFACDELGRSAITTRLRGHSSGGSRRTVKLV